ncbi:MAG: PD-(D/E)XK nuclease domain-containing protein, partial [Desulfovibrionaceae bacterium]|nr:PD-(D/E)XK nuclease domain-containing protein [Desulfovibrionaceae bacterium]
IFEDQISDWFNRVGVNKNNFIKSLLQNDLEGMNVWMTEISKNVFSYFDTANSNNSEKEERPESFYHAFVLGLIVDLKQYEISSNGDSGYGRYDVMLVPKKLSDHGIVIEFKTYQPKKETDLDQTCNNALKQIYNKEYITKLKVKDIALENIYVYGFGFKGKIVQIIGGSYTQIDWQKVLQIK